MAKKKPRPTPPIHGRNPLPQPESTGIELDASAKAAIELAEEIAERVEDVPERARDKNADFFESVVEKAESIAETVRRTGRASEAQTVALENMLEGVEKWIR